MSGYLAGLQPPTQAQWGSIGWAGLIVFCLLILSIGLRG